MLNVVVFVVIHLAPRRFSGRSRLETGQYIATLCGGIRMPCGMYGADVPWSLVCYTAMVCFRVSSGVSTVFSSNCYASQYLPLSACYLSRWTLAGVSHHLLNPRQEKTRMVAGNFESFVVGSCQWEASSPLYHTKLSRKACTRQGLPTCGVETAVIGRGTCLHILQD